MKVLIIGHNVFSKSNNMGKTLLSYFKDFSPEETAQFYIQDKLPSTGAVCQNYYRFTDKDAVRSLWPFREYGRVFTSSDIICSDEQQTDNTGLVNSAYQYGRKRNGAIYIARNLLWSLARWKTGKFLAWMKDFDPDVIFFMSGDYGFMYKIADFAVEYLHKPLVAVCVDDYYLFNRNASTLSGRLQQKSYMKKVHKVMEKAACILTISDSMRDTYEELFRRPCHTLHTSAFDKKLLLKPDRSKVAYFGNLGYKRNDRLVEIGRAVKGLSLPWLRGIEVYSGEKNPKYLENLTEENGIFFRGKITAEQVSEKMAECMAILHTESFDPIIRGAIKYSVSTKIAESLMNGPCLIAYGPDDIASIEYLQRNNAAYVITRPEELSAGLREILTNQELREQIEKNARELAHKNHDEAVNPKLVRAWLEEAQMSHQ